MGEKDKNRAFLLRRKPWRRSSATISLNSQSLSSASSWKALRACCLLMPG